MLPLSRTSAELMHPTAAFTDQYAPMLPLARLLLRALRSIPRTQSPMLAFVAFAEHDFTPGATITWPCFQSCTPWLVDLDASVDDDGRVIMCVLDSATAVPLKHVSRFAAAEAEWMLLPGTNLHVECVSRFGGATIVRLCEVACL